MSRGAGDPKQHDVAAQNGRYLAKRLASRGERFFGKSITYGPNYPGSK